MEKVSELEKKLIQTTKEGELLKVKTMDLKSTRTSEFCSNCEGKPTQLFDGVCRRVFVSPAVR